MSNETDNKRKRDQKFPEETLPLSLMSICSYQTCSPTRDKFAGPQVLRRNFHLSSVTFLPFTGLSPSAGGHQVFPYFFHLILRTLGRLVFLQTFPRETFAPSTILKCFLLVFTRLSGKNVKNERICNRNYRNTIIYNIYFYQKNPFPELYEYIHREV